MNKEAEKDLVGCLCKASNDLWFAIDAIRVFRHKAVNEYGASKWMVSDLQSCYSDLLRAQSVIDKKIEDFEL